MNTTSINSRIFMNVCIYEMFTSSSMLISDDEQTIALSDVFGFAQVAG